MEDGMPTPQQWRDWRLSPPATASMEDRMPVFQLSREEWVQSPKYSERILSNALVSLYEDILKELSKSCRRSWRSFAGNAAEFQLERETEYYDKSKEICEATRGCLRHLTKSKAEEHITRIYIVWAWVRWCAIASPHIAESEMHHKGDKLIFNCLIDIKENFGWEIECLRPKHYHSIWVLAYPLQKRLHMRKCRPRMAQKLGLQYLTRRHENITECTICWQDLCFEYPQYGELGGDKLILCSPEVIDYLSLIECDRENLKTRLIELWNNWDEEDAGFPDSSSRKIQNVSGILSDTLSTGWDISSDIQVAIRRYWNRGNEVSEVANGQEYDDEDSGEDSDEETDGEDSSEEDSDEEAGDEEDSDEEDSDEVDSDDEEGDDEDEDSDEEEEAKDIPVLQQAVETRCGHQFGEYCLMRWLRMGNQNCPLCLQVLNASGPLYGEDARPDMFNKDRCWYLRQGEIDTDFEDEDVPLLVWLV